MVYYKERIISIFLVFLVLGVVPASAGSVLNVDSNNSPVSLSDILNQTNIPSNLSNSLSGNVKPLMQVQSYVNDKSSVQNTGKFDESKDVAANADTSDKNGDSVTNTAGVIVNYVEKGHALPDNITVDRKMVNTTQYIDVATKKIINIKNNKTNTTINFRDVKTPKTVPKETNLKKGYIYKKEYINLANDVQAIINKTGTAPSDITSSRGHINYYNYGYMFSQILYSYQLTKTLPDFIKILPWSYVSNNRTCFIKMAGIGAATDNVQSHIENKHTLPTNIVIGNSKVTMPQYLKITGQILINTNGNLYQSIALEKCNTPNKSQEDPSSVDLTKKTIIYVANKTIEYMDANNGDAPIYTRRSEGGDRIGYNSLIYLFSKVINSAAHMKALPEAVPFVTWAVVSDKSTIFLSMDQINTAAETVKLNVERDHTLPTTIKIGERNINMANFLNLEVKTIQNLKKYYYSSIIYNTYDNAPSPSEKWPAIGRKGLEYAVYTTLADNIVKFMKDNHRAPNFQETQGTSIRFENLVFMYSQIISYYNQNDKLPSSVVVHPWSIVINPNTITFSNGQIIDGAKRVITYVEKNHTLPRIVPIDGTNLSIHEFLKLAVRVLTSMDGTVGQLIYIKYMGNPIIGSGETTTGGKIDQTGYFEYVRIVESQIYDDERAKLVHYDSKTIGKICYENGVYIFSQILSSYDTKHVLPDFITVNPWKTITSSTTKFYTKDQIITEARKVTSSIEQDHTLPNKVFSGNVNIAAFLKLLTTTLTNINGNLDASIVFSKNYTIPMMREDIHAGRMNKNTYIKIANDIKKEYDTHNKAPTSARNTGLGLDMGFNNLVYTYSQILNSYNLTNSTLPSFITTSPWSEVSNSNTQFFTNDQIGSASKNVQAKIENHQTQTTVLVNNVSVGIPAFLKLLTTAVTNIDGNLNVSIVFSKNYTVPSLLLDNIHSGSMDKKTYVKIANDIKKYYDTSNKAPTSARNTGLGLDMGFSNLVYTYSQILNSYYTTNQTMPGLIQVTPWDVVNNNSTVFFTTDQMKIAATFVKSETDKNHKLPNNLVINNTPVSMSQFLKLSAKCVININNYLYTSVILEDVKDPGNVTENIIPGLVDDDEFVDIATKTVTYINSHRETAPKNIPDTSIRTIGYYSLIYMYSSIIVSSNATEHLPDQVIVIPALALFNPNGTYNFKTQKVFNNIKDAINDKDTKNSDTIWLGKTQYTENVIINKKIIIKPLYNLKVTIIGLNINLPIFTINNLGNGSTIQGLNITGAITGIYINTSNTNQIFGNTITSNNNGIIVENSNETVISGNTIQDNRVNGIVINTRSSESTVSANKIISNKASGISIQNSDNNTIYSNVITKNMNGIVLTDASTTIIFNSITNNNLYGLYNTGNGTVNATNNWWGTHKPLLNTTTGSVCDICNSGGKVTYDPYLVLTVDSSTDRSDLKSIYYKYFIVADLNRDNHGKDTSPEGTVPDNIPINFISTLGTVESTGTTKNGRVEIKLNNTIDGTATISATLDNQTTSRNVVITATIMKGVTNTRTGESFSTIQEAINTPSTHPGDTIRISEGTYTENIIVNKRLTIIPLNNAKVIFKAKDPEKPVIVITHAGSGSKIQGLNIISPDESYGIALSRSYNNNIQNNNITGNGNSKGIYVWQSGNNNIENNTIKNNYYGIYIYNSGTNTITENTLTTNEVAIFLMSSSYNTITMNIISNDYYGVYLVDSNTNKLTQNSISGSWAGIYLYNTNYNTITGNTLTKNGAGITYWNAFNENISENIFVDNYLSDTSTVDSSDVTMSTTIYDCGPAALATVLNRNGVITSEDQINYLAGTDETGTTLYALKDVAIMLGIDKNKVNGVKITLDQLQKNNIAVLKIGNISHYVVIENINSTTVSLFDPNLGNIEMNRDKFNKLYTGVALLINQTVTTGTILTDEEMKNIKAQDWVQQGGYYTYHYYTTWKKITISLPYIKIIQVPVYAWGHYICSIPWGQLAWYQKNYYLPIPHITKTWHPKYVWKEPNEKRFSIGKVFLALKTINTIRGATGIGAVAVGVALMTTVGAPVTVLLIGGILLVGGSIIIIKGLRDLKDYRDDPYVDGGGF